MESLTKVKIQILLCCEPFALCDAAGAMLGLVCGLTENSSLKRGTKKKKKGGALPWYHVET